MNSSSQFSLSYADNIRQKVQALAPGFSISLVAAAAASFLSEHYGAPVMLFALLLGMGLSFLSVEGRCKAGIEFALVFDYFHQCIGYENTV